jgi:transcriptional regulator with XRE-family HTH domain
MFYEFYSFFMIFWNCMDYSGRIRKIRNFFSMNQKEFALLLNTARTALSELESGSREPSKDFILALSSVGVSIDWFLTGKGEPLSSYFL